MARRLLALVLALAGCPTSQPLDLGDDTADCADATPCPAVKCDPAAAGVAVGDLQFCAETTTTSFRVRVQYTGAEKLVLAGSQVLLNGEPIDAAASFDAATQSFTIDGGDLAPSKYSLLFRMKTDGGKDLRPLWIPMWIGDGVKFADFTWRDATIYQIFTDRFLDGQPSNNQSNTANDLGLVTDPRSQWQGGDFAGITQKLRDGYFDAMGVNTLWISSPIIDSHRSQPAVALADTRRFSSYHSYHPVATGYTYADHLGYATPIEPAFGTEAELRELVNEAHLHGIRILTDFVANHIQRDGKLYADHPDWFSAYNACDNRWDQARINCWFTSTTPDFDYGGKPEAVKKVVDHALWMAQEFNLDGFRADALKHMDDKFVRALKKGVVEELETTVKDHALAVEPTVFYMVGESLGGWARYHVREDMVQGQVDEEYYNKTKAALLTYDISLRRLAEFAIPNDTAYLTQQDTMGGRGGYPGAVMGNFFGNHDQVRALTEAINRGGGTGHERLRMAQVFLMTSPTNVPMLYQGDDIGTAGDADPDNRKMQRFTALTAAESISLRNVQRAGTLRAEHAAIRRGKRETVVLEDYFWVYKLGYQGDDVFVAINRDATKQWSPPAGYVDGLGVCSGGTVPVSSACIFVRQ